jgi:hypothetical protein
MYNGVKIIFFSPNLQTIIQLQLSKYRDLLFVISTLQNSITALWLKQWLQLALSHVQYRKTFQLCDMCPVLGLSSTGKLWCSISAQRWNFAILPYASHTLNNTSTCHVHKFEALLFWTRISDSKNQYSGLKISTKLYLTKGSKWITYSENTKCVKFQTICTEALGRSQLKCDGTCAETRFHLSAKRTSPFKTAGASFSRLLAAEVCVSAVIMLDTTCSKVVWRVLATHSIRQFPLHFPSRASPCAITFQVDS